MDTPPRIQDLASLDPEFDVSTYAEVRVVEGHALQQHPPGNGWIVLKIIQRDSVQSVQKSLAYPMPGCSPQTYFYQDNIVLREVAFLMARREKTVIEELTRFVTEAQSREYVANQQAGKLASSLEKTLQEKLEGETKAAREIARLEARLQEEKTEKEKAQTAYGIVFKEHESLKESLLKTLVKLPGGNEATLTEAIGMVKSHEILGGIKP